MFAAGLAVRFWAGAVLAAGMCAVLLQHLVSGTLTADSEAAKVRVYASSKLRAVLSILWQAAEPMTTRDIALEMSRALNTEDQRPTSLDGQARRRGYSVFNEINGVVRSVGGPGQFLLRS